MDISENIFGAIFLLVMAAISIIGKIREGRQAEERQKRLKNKRVEDLPEATRKMLYGDSMRPPVATPRGQQTRPAEMPTRQQAQVEVERQREVMFGGGAETRSDMAPDPVHRAPQQRHRQPQQPDPRRQAQDAMQRMWQQAQQAKLNEQQKRAQAAEQQRRRHAQKQARVEQPKRQRVPKPAPAPVRRAAPRQETSLASMLGNLDAVRQGIILQEVLGPPKALREPTGN